MANALGNVVPVREIVALAKRAGACTRVDGAQSVSHMRVDVRELDADFFVFSGHKIFGPTGIGALYGKMAPAQALREFGDFGAASVAASCDVEGAGGAAHGT